MVLLVIDGFDWLKTNLFIAKKIVKSFKLQFFQQWRSLTPPPPLFLQDLHKEGEAFHYSGNEVLTAHEGRLGNSLYQGTRGGACHPSRTGEVNPQRRPTDRPRTPRS